MASTNPFQHAEYDPLDGDDSAVRTGGPRKRRGADSSERVTRKKSRGVLRDLRSTADSVAGWPEFDSLKPVLMFLMMPAIVVLMITITGGGWPKPILYAIALGLGLVVAISAFRGVELILAVMLIYLPFSKMFVVPLAPGINGTNMLILLGLFASILRSLDKRQNLAAWPPGTTMVAVFGVLTAASAFTVFQIPGGRMNLMYNELLSYKAWLDQFIFYFIVLTCIRNVETAKRCVIYMMIGSILVVLYTVPEMLDKMGRSSIEKMRVDGPHLQSNNFGGFVSYTLLPLVAVFIVFIKDLRVWLLTPYFLIAAKVLIVTFSRGAYLAMVIGGLMAGWFKGKGFLAFWAALGLSFLLVFPSLIPEAITARMGTLAKEETTSEATADQKLDKSSASRLVMWRAAGQMIMEDPILGKGFKGFAMLKDEYTAVPLEESDPHSMYLYIGSQMGLPALALFILILGYSFYLGRLLSQNEHDRFIKAIGIGGASATACYAVVCIFGSRAVSLNFSAYFWAYLVVMQVLKQKQTELQESQNPKKGRTNAFVQRNSTNQKSTSDSDYADSDTAPFSGPTSSADSNRRRDSARKSPSRGAAAHQKVQQQQEQGTDVPANTPAAEPIGPLSRSGRRSRRTPLDGSMVKRLRPRRGS